MECLKLLKTFSAFVFFLISIPVNWSQKKLPSRGFAGFGYRAITQADVDSMNLSDTNGVYINIVLPDSPAERAGFRVSNILKKYDDHVILDNLQFVGIYQKPDSGFCGLNKGYLVTRKVQIFLPNLPATKILRMYCCRRIIPM